MTYVKRIMIFEVNKVICHFLYKDNVTTQFLTHVLIFFQEKNPKIAKNIENPKNIFFNIFASFLEFLTSSQKNLNFQRF
jgi:hypothetical protein